MKAQDLVIMLKIALQKDPCWMVMDMARSLYLSQSEVSKALERLSFSGLLDESKKHLARQALYDYIVNAVKYSFPVRPNGLTRGIATSHCASPLKSKIMSDDKYVWPHISGKVRGQAIKPLYKGAPDAALEDEELHELLALIDALRVGKAREQEIAKKELKKRILK